MGVTVTYVTAFTDNYIWLLVDEIKRQVIVIDPGDGSPVLDFVARNALDIAAILITHKHFDHSAGVQALLTQDIPVYASAKEHLSCTTHTVSAGETLAIRDWPTTFEVLEIPGHTLGHVAYYAEPFLFCGDTLFTGGCGRIFEGTPAQMLASLEKLTALPDETLVYCGHEYTLQNLQFALQVEPENEALQARLLRVTAMRQAGQATVPETLGIEKATNPFLRCHEPEVRASVSARVGASLDTVEDVFRALREWKNEV